VVTAIGARAMTQSSNKKKEDLPFVSVQKDGDLDQIIVHGKTIDEDFYPETQVCYIGMSDGTLLRYDGSTDRKLSVIEKGSGYLDIAYKEGMYSSYITFNEEEVFWVMCGELH